MLRHITNPDGSTFSSNLPKECLPCQQACQHLSQALSCPLNGEPRRTGTISTASGSVFLCFDKETKSSSRFKQALQAYGDVLEAILDIKNDQVEQNVTHLRRLTHNLVSYNAHILQDIYTLVSQEELAGDGKNQLRVLTSAVSKDPSKTAISILRILKNANLSKAEFSIFDKLYEMTPDLEFFRHNIHKVILLVFNSFWQDFIDKGVRINIQPCTNMLFIDYESISAALAHIVDNAAKYIAPGTELGVSFNQTESEFQVEFDMISLGIEPGESQRLFDEGYSGINAQNAQLSGQGIGLYVVDRLLALNNAAATVAAASNSSSSFLLDGLPYQRNVVRITFRESSTLADREQDAVKTGFHGRALRSRR